ncbi:hypothetical protein [Citreicella sp. C3M06]|uniref:hypothetical protein n=1 Tax=Citreicella sp. C3M06 TaxID=2841564 RepID=UPI00352C876C
MTEAETKAGPVWEQLVAMWEAKLAGDDSDAEKRYLFAQELAEMRGFRYLHVSKVAELPLEELAARIEAIPVDRKGRPDQREAQALLGAVEQPKITVSRALELYWELAREKTINKSDDQLRKWRNPRIRAVKAFISVVGDLALQDITGDDMLNFRAWWVDRIQNEGLSPGSANKDLIHLGDVLKTVNQMKRLGLVLPLDSLSFKESEAAQMPALLGNVDQGKVTCA